MLISVLCILQRSVLFHALYTCIGTRPSLQMGESLSVGECVPLTIQNLKTSAYDYFILVLTFHQLIGASYFTVTLVSLSTQEWVIIILGGIG